MIAALIAATGVSLAVYFAWSLLRIGARDAPEPSGRPNLLFVTLDTTRADHLSVYGYARDTSPAMERVARDGFAFTEAFTVATYSGPSQATMFTGLFPLQHGLVDNGLRLSREAPYLPELLDRLGYRTGAFVGYDVVGAEADLDRGFDEFELHLIESHNHEQKSLEYEVAGFRAAGDWLEAWHRAAGGERGQPFFLWLHAQQAHQSYDPPPPYDAKFMAVPRGSAIAGTDSFRPRCANDVREALERGLLSEETKAQVEALYDGEIRLVDDELGALFDLLRQQGVYDDTIIVIVADHGEQLFEPSEIDFGRGGFRHSRIYFDPVLRIPLIVKPRTASFPRVGLRPSVTASTVDLFPTLLDLLGLEAPAQLPGRSLVPWMEDPGVHDARDAIYFQEIPNERFYSGLRTADWKFVRKVEQGEATRWLIDLANDPGERTDVHPVHRETADALERQLDGWLSTQQAVTPSSLADMSERMRRALRDAGYVRSDADGAEGGRASP